jgi:hypothetical protein
MTSPTTSDFTVERAESPVGPWVWVAGPLDLLTASELARDGWAACGAWRPWVRVIRAGATLPALTFRGGQYRPSSTGKWERVVRDANGTWCRRV